MTRRPTRQDGSSFVDRGESTQELSGRDARPSEARSGDAGSGASAFGADTTGLESPAPDYEEEFSLEPDPSRPRDILPDAVIAEGEETENAPLRRLREGALPVGGRSVSRLMRRARGRIRVDQEVSLQNLRRSLARTRYLPIVDDQHRFQGFITRSDVLSLAGRSREEMIPVRSLLRTAPQVREDETPEAVAHTLLRAGAHLLPVADAEGRFIGLVSDHAVLRNLLPRRPSGSHRATSAAVDAVMTRSPVSIGPDASVEQAAGVLLEAGIRHLPVVDTDGRVVGILSERDIRERIGSDPREWFHAAAEALEDQVGRVMTPDPVVVRAGSLLTDALEILESERVGALPVVDDDDRLVGVLSYVDALGWIRDILSRRP